MSKEEVRRITAAARRQGIDPTSAKATYWLKENLEKIGPVKREPILKKGISAQSIEPGHFYFFAYIPKGKSELPFYDEFPLVFVMNYQKGGFLGVNFHYLEMNYRAWFINGLVKYADTTQWNLNPDAEIDAEYPDFKADPRLRFYRPTIKSYKYNCIVSNVAMVPPSEWKTAIFMPLERFAKMSSNEVYKWSRNQI